MLSRGNPRSHKDRAAASRSTRGRGGCAQPRIPARGVGAVFRESGRAEHRPPAAGGRSHDLGPARGGRRTGGRPSGCGGAGCRRARQPRLALPAGRRGAGSAGGRRDRGTRARLDNPRDQRSRGRDRRHEGVRGGVRPGPPPGLRRAAAARGVRGDLARRGRARRGIAGDLELLAAHRAPSLLARRGHPGGRAARYLAFPRRRAPGHADPRALPRSRAARARTRGATRGPHRRGPGVQRVGARYRTRLLDWERGGFCSIEPETNGETSLFRNYEDGTLVLETTFRSPQGEARLIDCFTVLEGEERPPHRRELIRIVEGERGALDFRIRIVPRFDYGAVEPWIRRHGPGSFSAIGGRDALLIWSDAELEPPDRHSLEAMATVRPGERIRLSITSVDPPQADAPEVPDPADSGRIDQRLDATRDWWRSWTSQQQLRGPDAPAVARSATVLKGLTYAPTGALAAAATTSLPEGRGLKGERNWDYRYSWIRD